jgi:hypothetical protein
MLQQNKRIVRTELCTASAKNKKWFRVPSSRKSNPIEFDNLMQSLGIPPEIAQNECIRFHGPALADYMGSVEHIPDAFQEREISCEQLRLSFRKKS